MNNKDKAVGKSRFEEIGDPYQYWKDEFDGLEEAYLERRERLLCVVDELIRVTYDMSRAELFRDQAEKDQEVNNYGKQK